MLRSVNIGSLLKKKLLNNNNKLFKMNTKSYHTQQHHIKEIKTIEGLKCAVLKPKDKVSNSLMIWLHGLGDTYDGFSEMMKYIIPSQMTCILPNAPIRPITCNGGMRMNGWYDIISLDRSIMEKNEDKEGILRSKVLLDNLILNQIKELKEEINGEYKHIIIGGFSQGAAMSMLVGCQSTSVKFSAIISTSGYVLLRNELKPYVLEKNKDTPLYVYHGLDDDVVNYECFAKKSFDQIENEIKIERKIYNYHSHEVTDEEMQDLQTLFHSVVNEK
ncbi:hypothetical protein ABK040_015131 [Willaertia magna]